MNSVSTPCYTDDTSIIHSSSSRRTNQVKLEQHLDITVLFLNKNRLNLNQEKTTVCEVMTRQKRTRLGGLPPSLTVIDRSGQQKLIGDESYTRILGCNIGRNLGWSAHLITGQKVLLPKLRKQLGAHKLISRELPCKSKLLLANGLIISKICYMIQAWGGEQDNLLRKMQTILNDTAQFVTGLNKCTRMSKLMKCCNWLNIHELIDYQSLITLWRTVYLNIPEQIAEHLAISEDKTISTKPARLLIVIRSSRHITVKVWNLLPSDVTTISAFKKSIKDWIMSKRKPDPG